MTKSSELQARAAQLPKPSVGQVLKLVKFLIKRLDVLQDIKDIANLNDPTKSGFAVIEKLVNSISEADILELGKILLMDDSVDLKVEDVDLVFLTEALAVWTEKVDLATVLKNARRVAEALKSRGSQATP